MSVKDSNETDDQLSLGNPKNGYLPMLGVVPPSNKPEHNSIRPAPVIKKKKHCSAQKSFLDEEFLNMCNSHTIKCTHLKCLIQWFLVYSQSSAAISTTNFRTFSATPLENLASFRQSLPRPHVRKP